MQTADYAVIALYVVAITAFGSWFARYQRTTRDYFLTGHTVPWWGVCFTIVATETSTLSFVGVPAAAYAGNMTFLQIALGYILGRIVISIVLLPAYFRGELYTSYELLGRRFGPSVQTLAAGIFLITRTLADGVRLFATALVIAVVTGVPVGWTVVVLGTAMIVYSARGGAAAVIWTDVIQMFVYIAGALVVFSALLTAIPGGWAEITRAGTSAGKFTVFNWSFDPKTVYTFWAGVLGGATLSLATHGTDQYLVQRLLAARSARDARLGLVLSGFLVLAQFALFLVIGVMLFAYYQGAPPTLTRTDEILPTFVVDRLTGGAAGFIVAAIVAAALSPSLNAMAAATVNDFYRRYARPGASEPTLLRVSKIATVGWGVAQIAVAIAAQWMDRSVLDAGLAILSLAAGPVLGAFLIGVLTRHVSAPAMLGGMAAGVVVLVWCWWSEAIAWTWYALIGASVSALAALALAAAAGAASRGNPARPSDSPA
jgi:solute:Na+ symporter, SSS family